MGAGILAERHQFRQICFSRKTPGCFKGQVLPGWLNKRETYLVMKEKVKGTATSIFLLVRVNADMKINTKMKKILKTKTLRDKKDNKMYSATCSQGDVAVF